MMLTLEEIAAIEAQQVTAARANARPQDWPADFSHENGQYECRCLTCKKSFIGHKRRAFCRLCDNQ